MAGKFGFPLVRAPFEIGSPMLGSEMRTHDMILGDDGSPPKSRKTRGLRVFFRLVGRFCFLL